MHDPIAILTQDHRVFPHLERHLDRETLAEPGDAVAAAKQPKRKARS